MYIFCKKKLQWEPLIEVVLLGIVVNSRIEKSMMGQSKILAHHKKKFKIKLWRSFATN
jgi:hypothetical protein